MNVLHVDIDISHVIIIVLHAAERSMPPSLFDTVDEFVD